MKHEVVLKKLLRTDDPDRCAEVAKRLVEQLVSTRFDMNEQIEVFCEPRLSMEANGNTSDYEVLNPASVERRQQIDPVA